MAVLADTRFNTHTHTEVEHEPPRDMEARRIVRNVASRAVDKNWKFKKPRIEATGDTHVRDVHLIVGSLTGWSEEFVVTISVGTDAVTAEIAKVGEDGSHGDVLLTIEQSGAAYNRNAFGRTIVDAIGARL